ncbi:hypothetical protein Anas_07285 [Armadillidium nasatum]|uniref:Coiled-coil-helix-coiled-coil-helix domain-containing protein 1 n=1 Tax=Armadillidium nasatum TaxID=96803 RepID=A0A5N5SRW7_9CRUS|nr:hypothetical protein Anas_07285 [Armadillidium nasatum]
MRNSNILYLSRYTCYGSTPKNGRGTPKVPFPYIGPKLALRNKVVDTSSKQESKICFTELMELLSCLKEGDFNEKLCFEHQSKLKLCEEKYLATIEKEQEIRRKGTLTPGAKTLTSAQANILLKKYPQPGV